MKRGLIVLVLLAAAGGGVYWWTQRRAEKPPLEFAGSLEARTVSVGSLVGGRVLRVLVDEGARVAAGQLLIELDPDLLDLQIAQQKAAIAEARATLQKTAKGPRAEEVRRAQIAWQAAETDRQRFESLWKSGVLAKREFDAAAVAEATAKETLREAQRGGRREDVAAAQAALSRMEEQQAYLERQRQELAIKAPSPGVVEALTLRPGDLVAPNQATATLLEDGQLWVRVYVPEPDLGRVRIGQRIDVFVDSFPERAFPGKVVEIRDRGEYTPRNLQTIDQRSDQVFGVKIEVAPAPELKAGMTATARLSPPQPPSPGSVG